MYLLCRRLWGTTTLISDSTFPGIHRGHLLGSFQALDVALVPPLLVGGIDQVHQGLDVNIVEVQGITSLDLGGVNVIADVLLNQREDVFVLHCVYTNREYGEAHDLSKVVEFTDLCMDFPEPGHQRVS